MESITLTVIDHDILRRVIGEALSIDKMIRAQGNAGDDPREFLDGTEYRLMVPRVAVNVDHEGFTSRLNFHILNLYTVQPGQLRVAAHLTHQGEFIRADSYGVVYNRDLMLTVMVAGSQVEAVRYVPGDLRGESATRCRRFDGFRQEAAATPVPALV